MIASSLTNRLTDWIEAKEEDEEMPRFPLLLMPTRILFLATVAIECASQEKYRYQTIKAEYADLACNLDQSRVAGKSAATCAVYSSLTLKEVLDIARAMGYWSSRR